MAAPDVYKRQTQSRGYRGAGLDRSRDRQTQGQFYLGAKQGPAYLLGQMGFGRYDRHTPVSYTHLDVYKRQSMNRMQSARIGRATALACVLGLSLAACGGGGGGGGNTVSYTHLYSVCWRWPW